jgi:hypothetical protein
MTSACQNPCVGVQFEKQLGRRGDIATIFYIDFPIPRRVYLTPARENVSMIPRCT